MSHPQYAIEYLGAVEAKKNQPVNTADIITLYPAATVMKIKSRGVKVSVNNTPMFEISLDDESYITSGHTYIFSEDCVAAIGTYKAVT